LFNFRENIQKKENSENCVEINKNLYLWANEKRHFSFNPIENSSIKLPRSLNALSKHGLYDRYNLTVLISKEENKPMTVDRKTVKNIIKYHNN
jgi:hypothetical protein